MKKSIMRTEKALFLKQNAYTTWRSGLHCQKLVKHEALTEERLGGN